ncbi:unnamed protein product [Brassica napus]|uniref:(rape) hypothetical protein n=1 Tax=Brassica napus TaxID=3708 RepID=A0A816LPP1_BRANA|nr:unnamed protein product [Brassica napus]
MKKQMKICCMKTRMVVKCQTIKIHKHNTTKKSIVLTLTMKPVHQMSSFVHNHVKALWRWIPFKFLVQESNKEAKQDEEVLFKDHRSNQFYKGVVHEEVRKNNHLKPP